MEWDFFRCWRVYGGWDKVANYVHHVDTETQGLVWIKTDEPVGSEIHYEALPQGVFMRTPFENDPKGKVLRSFSKNDFEHFDLKTASPEELQAIGELMCGVCLHGQWFAELFENIRT